MIKEAYVSYDVAKLLKEKGFNEPCRGYYCCFENGDRVHTEYAPIENHNVQEKFVSMPTHQMTLAWLTNIHGLFISVCPDINDKLCFYSDIYKKNEYCWEQIDYNLDGYNTTDEAVEAALKYSLENLI